MLPLKEGDKAPDFTARDQEGKEVSLKSLLGKNVILYFYPKDDTPGCTSEACNFRDNYSLLQEKKLEVIGVSIDDEIAHKQFKDKYKLPFTLLADTEKKIVQAYGVWGEKNVYGKKHMGIERTTFVIGSDGYIKKIIKKVDTQNAAQQILKLCTAIIATN